LICIVKFNILEIIYDKNGMTVTIVESDIVLFFFYLFTIHIVNIQDKNTEK